MTMKTIETLMKAFLAVAAGALLFSCQKTPVTELSVSPIAVNFEAAASENTVSVTCNDAWTASTSADWISLSPASGNGNGTIKISVKANEAFSDRNADVTVKAGDKSATIKVGQISLAPSLIVDLEKIDAEAGGGEFELTITSNTDWTVAVPENDWVTLDKTSGKGSGKVKVTVKPTTLLEPRTLDLKVNAMNLSHTVKVNQAALVPALSVNPEKVETGAAATSCEVVVESNVAWKVEIPEDASWIKADKTSGTGDDKVIFSLETNPARKVRKATVTFSCEQDLKKEVLFSQAEAVPSRQTDSLALVAIYNAGDGASWKEDRRWDLTKPIDTWNGITVEGNRVTKIQITAQGVIPAEWTLPHEIGDLNELTVLKINQNKVKGEIPEEVYGLTKLTDLWIQNSSLTGTLSDKLGQLTELKNLYIDRNKNLGGSIPATIGNLTKLESINIAQTGIGGAIPQELSKCISLKNFMAYSNQLSGQIPDFWDKLPNIGVLQLYSNPGITGPLPATMGTLKKATGIQLRDCNITGNIPVSFAGLEKCNQLFLYGNKMSGVVPAEVQNHPNWVNNKWKVETNILPQQEGYGLTIK